MIDLDQPATYSQWDPSGLGARLRRLPEQCRAGWLQGEGVEPLHDWDPSGVDKIVVCGMGGSAIAGNLVSDLIGASSTASRTKGCPILVVRGMEFPFSLDQRSLVIPCSHSGNTSETISLFHRATEAGARILVVAGSGRLAKEALKRDLPLLKIGVKGEPRSSVGYSLMLLAAVLCRHGLATFDSLVVTSSIDALEKKVSRLTEDVPTRENAAKQLALALAGKLIAVYGGGLFAGMARRWKTQLNENAKAWAFFEEVPELLHNAVEAFTQPPGDPGLGVALLQPSVEGDPLAAHYAAAETILADTGVPVEVLKGDPEESPLAQLLGMLALGDYVSYYLAMLKGVDPSPSPNIDKAKDLLAQ